MHVIIIPSEHFEKKTALTVDREVMQLRSEQAKERYQSIQKLQNRFLASRNERVPMTMAVQNAELKNLIFADRISRTNQFISHPAASLLYVFKKFGFVFGEYIGSFCHKNECDSL